MAKKRKSGTKSGMTPEVLKRVEKLAGEGFNKSQIADAIGVVRETISMWLRTTKFSKAFHRGVKKHNDEQEERIKRKIDSVEDAAFKRAQGYTTTETKLIYSMMKNGKEKLIRKEVREVHIPADPGAFKFILLNKRPKEYQEHVDVSARFDGQLAIRVIKASESKKDESKPGN